jgi:hypothetical protein
MAAFLGLAAVFIVDGNSQRAISERITLERFKHVRIGLSVREESFLITI